MTLKSWLGTWSSTDILEGWVWMNVFEFMKADFRRLYMLYKKFCNLMIIRMMLHFKLFQKVYIFCHSVQNYCALSSLARLKHFSNKSAPTKTSVLPESWRHYPWWRQFTTRGASESSALPEANSETPKESSNLKNPEEPSK